MKTPEEFAKLCIQLCEPSQYEGVYTKYHGRLITSYFNAEEAIKDQTEMLLTDICRAVTNINETSISDFDKRQRLKDFFASFGIST